MQDWILLFPTKKEDGGAFGLCESAVHKNQYNRQKKRLNPVAFCDNIVRYMNRFMEEALAEARIAFELGEVPIGAVIEKDGQIIARGHNLTESAKDPTAHAEMMAIREAAKVLGGWRLPGCSLYVTVEPCSMCAGAMVWSRIENLYIGTMDPKAGACGSVFNIPGEERLNHSIHVETGILEEECSKIMKDFFVQLRNKKKNK